MDRVWIGNGWYDIVNVRWGRRDSQAGYCVGGNITSERATGTCCDCCDGFCVAISGVIGGVGYGIVCVDGDVINLWCDGCGGVSGGKWACWCVGSVISGGSCIFTGMSDKIMMGVISV